MGPLATCQRGSALSHASKDTTRVYEKSTIYLCPRIPGRDERKEGAKGRSVQTRGGEAVVPYFAACLESEISDHDLVCYNALYSVKVLPYAYSMRNGEIPDLSCSGKLLFPHNLRLLLKLSKKYFLLQ